MDPINLFLLILLLGAIILLAVWNLPPDGVFLGILIIVILLGVLSPEEALVGFSNQGMLTIGALYIVAAGLRETGAVQSVVKKVLGRPKSMASTQARIIAPIMLMSSVLNNTPIVASFIPALQEWAKKYRVPSSKLLIPLSYAAILGGTCTLIGTSTNLIINGLLISDQGVSLHLFEPAFVGLPISIAGFVYLMIVGRRWLPDIDSVYNSFKKTREYTIEMIIKEGSPLIGNTIEGADLRDLPGLFIVEIVRNGTILAAVDPNEVLCENDRLIFTGLVDSIADLQSIQGLVPATDQVFKLDTPRRDRHLVEAVVSTTNILNGKTIKEGEFRNVYGAVVLAVSRRGSRVNKKVGDIILQAGDVLLMEAPRDFSARYKFSSDFLLVSTLARKTSYNYKKSGVAWGILLSMILMATFQIVSMFQASFVAAGLMILTGCISMNHARNSIDWQVLIVIAAALGVGNALQISGLATELVELFTGLAGSDPYLMLIVLYLITWILTEFLTNNAVAVITFPFAISLAASTSTDFMPYVMVIMFAASASFATPIGYQTNLMVYGAGGYKFSDFLKIGIPLNLIVAIITIFLVPIIWPF